MAVFETWLVSDIGQPVTVKKLSGNLFSADSQGNLVGVKVVDGDKPAEIQGNVSAYIIRGDNKTVVVSGTLEENRAWIILPASAYVVVGRISIVIKVGTITVGACTGSVYKTTTDDIIDPGHEIPSLAELLQKIADCEQATSDANEAATLANEKAELADTKAELADTKAALADEAADTANDAADLAVEKAGLADDAATSANAAATLANTKAELADEKAGVANDAAEGANTAAGTAISAAGTATTAAATANTAAGKINNMTVAAMGRPAGSEPTATISEVSGHKHILFGIPKGDKGDPGRDFHIARTFTSVAQMEAYDPSLDPSPLEDYDFVMIDTGSVEDPETGRLYCYEPENEPIWRYIGDLSGAQGIQGPKGDTGATPDFAIGTVTTVEPDQPASASITGTAEAPILNLDIPRGEDGVPADLYATNIPMSTTDQTTVAAAMGNKADKVSNATTGNFAALNASGNLVDSGSKASDFLTQHQDISGKADKDTDAVVGNFASFDANGNPVDSGHKHSDYLTAHQDISGKADKVSGATSGNFAGLDANGNLTDSGEKASDFATTQDLADKADKADTVLDTTLSRGRVENSTVGTASFAFGISVTASGNYSHAEGGGTTASGGGAHAEGGGSTASGEQAHAEGSGTQATAQSSHAEGSGSQATAQNAHAEGGGSRATGQSSHAEGGGSQALGISSHAEGGGTQATGDYSHAEGGGTLASALDSHAEGCGTIASGAYSHIGGTWNVADSYGNWPEWTANTAYAVGDKVKRTTTSDSDTIITGYICKTAHTSGSSFSETNWNNQNGRMNYAEIIGNGSANLDRSNIRALDWDGNERLMGDLYVGCNADSTGGTKVAKITDIPTVSDMTGATSSAAGTHGLVPAPSAGDENKVLKGDGTWGTVSSGTEVNTADFSIATYDWTLTSGMYVYSISNSGFASNTKELVQYDSSVLNLNSGLEIAKDPTTFAAIFRTKKLPSGTIAGTILSFNNQYANATGVSF